MRAVHKWLVIIFGAVLAACASGPQRPTQVEGDNYAYTRNYIRWMIGEKMVENDIVGLSIALVDDQKIIWAEGFGYADKKNKIAATPQTIYRVGSITKLFTATAVMQLAEQGKLIIGLPLKRYLPHFSIKSRFKGMDPITPRSLMTHHSGLPSDRLNRMWGDESANFTEVATDLKSEYVANPPNTILSYSNLGFSLLGLLVEQLSGKPYADYLEQNILRPMGMQNAYIAPNLRDNGNQSKGYFNRKEQSTPHLRDTPAGSLNSNVVDLARFAQMTFADGRSNGAQILKSETLALMQSYQDGDATFDVNRSIGLAWFIDDRFGEDAGIIAQHNGSTPMFFSEFLTLPKHKLAVVVLANSNTAGRAVGEIAEELLKLALESKAGIKVKEPAELKQKLVVLKEDLKRLPGAWSSPVGLVKIRRRGKRLKRLSVEIDGNKLNLVRREDGHYHLQYKLLGLLPINLGGLEKAGIKYQQIADREVVTLYLDGQPRAVIAEKAYPTRLSDKWKKHLGRYESINAKGIMELKSVELSHEDKLLLMELAVVISPGEIEEEQTVVLRPITDNQAVIHGLGRNMGETVQFVESNGEMLMSYSGFLLRRVE